MTVVMTQSELCADQYIRLEKFMEDIQTKFLSSYYTHIPLSLLTAESVCRPKRKLRLRT